MTYGTKDFDISIFKNLAKVSREEVVIGLSPLGKVKTFVHHFERKANEGKTSKIKWDPHNSTTRITAHGSKGGKKYIFVIVDFLELLEWFF